LGQMTAVIYGMGQSLGNSGHNASLGTLFI
jgi:hypothetical protein